MNHRIQSFGPRQLPYFAMIAAIASIVSFDLNGLQAQTFPSDTAQSQQFQPAPPVAGATGQFVPRQDVQLIRPANGQAFPATRPKAGPIQYPAYQNQGTDQNWQKPSIAKTAQEVAQQPAPLVRPAPVQRAAFPARGSFPQNANVMPAQGSGQFQTQRTAATSPVQGAQNLVPPQVPTRLTTTDIRTASSANMQQQNYNQQQFAPRQAQPAQQFSQPSQQPMTKTTSFAPNGASQDVQDQLSVKSYFVPAAKIDKVDNYVRNMFGTKQNNVTVAVDKIAEQILIMGTDQEQAAIARFMKTQGITSGDLGSTVKKPTEKISRNYTLKHINSRDLETIMARVWGASSIEYSQDNRFSRVMLPGGGKNVLVVDRVNNAIRYDGPEAAMEDWYVAMRAFDLPKSTAQQTAYLRVPEQEAGEQIRQVIGMMRVLALSHDKTAPMRLPKKLTNNLENAKWGAKMVSTIFKPSPKTNAQDEGAPAATQDGPQDGTQQPIAGFKAPVQIEFSEELGVLLVRGDEEDVQRIQKIINDIILAAEQTQPEVDQYELQHVEGQDVQPIVQELYDNFFAPRLGPASVVALNRPNNILLIGSKQSIQILKETLSNLDKKPVTPTNATFKIFKIQNMSVGDLATRLASFYSNQAGGGGNQTSFQGGVIQVEDAGFGTRLRVVPDYRSNTMIVQANPSQMAEIEKFIKALDVTDSEAKNEVKIFRLKAALASELAPILQDALNGQQPNAGTAISGNNQAGGNQALNNNGAGSQIRSAMLALKMVDPEGKSITSSILFDARVIAETNSNSLMVVAPEGAMALIGALISELDRLPSVESRLKVFTIVNADAETLLTAIQGLFQGTATGGGANQGAVSTLPLQTSATETSLLGVRFALDVRTNSIIAAGTEGDLQVVEALLVRLDSNNVNNRVNKVFRLQNVLAEDVEAALDNWVADREDILSTDPSTNNNIQLARNNIDITSDASTSSNSLIVSATPETMPIIERIIRQIDRRRRIVVQAMLAEVTLNDTEEFGIEWGLQDSLLFDRGLAQGINFGFNENANGAPLLANGVSGQESVAGQILSNLAVGRTSGNAGFSGLVLSAGNESVSILARALKNRGATRLLNRPSIMTVEGKTGTANVGQQFPFVDQVTITNGIQQVTPEYRDVGVQLQVLPRIGEDGLVYMEAIITNNSIGANVQLQAGVNSPIINQTEAQTVAVARSGQTVVVGGLISTSVADNTNTLPFIGDIPVLGRLFRFDSHVQTRSELIVILRPIIIEDDEDLSVMNQLEFDRMNWCFEDVIKIHGDVQGIYPYTEDNGATQTIRVDGNPGGIPNIPSESIRTDVTPPQVDRSLQAPQVDPQASRFRRDSGVRQASATSDNNDKPRGYRGFSPEPTSFDDTNRKWNHTFLK